MINNFALRSAVQNKPRVINLNYLCPQSLNRFSTLFNLLGLLLQIKGKKKKIKIKFIIAQSIYSTNLMHKCMNTTTKIFLSNVIPGIY